ncbi:MAG: hypothetical protein Q9Q40_13285 [Acidobacteriota bacterium]|nr:hypothetical protein [Acidobacteriota bacterium]MDQ7088534.1 hypothetical protein [Acidobacteriota bacterium]
MSRSSRSDGSGPTDRRLAEIASGARPDAAEALALLTDSAVRRRLVALDPTAVFAPLGGLPPAEGVPAYRSPLPAADRSWRRGGVAAAAALVVAGALWGLAGPTGQPVSRLAAARVEPVVRRIDSATAQVITIVPATAQGPTLTLIIDEELDL